jgi:hypothetical protein
MNENEKVNDNNKIIYQRAEKFQAIWQKQSFISYGFWIIIVLCLTALIHIFLKTHESPIRNLIYSLVFAAVLIYWFTSIPFLGTLIVITIRTRSRNFFYQLFTNLGLLIVVSVVPITNFIEFKESLESVLYIGFLLVLITLEVIFLRLVIQGARNNKKPIFLWTFYQDSFEAYSSSLLSQQALLISEEENGYSQRPFFVNFSEINQYSESNLDSMSKMKDYSKFLMEKSELISSDEFEDSIIFYPRVLMGYNKYGFGIRYMWRIFLKIIEKRDLTSITVNFTTNEISLKIIREDYEILNDVTFHLLGQLVLERFKESILAFLEGDKDKSYSILFPLKES